MCDERRATCDVRRVIINILLNPHPPLPPGMQQHLTLHLLRPPLHHRSTCSHILQLPRHPPRVSPAAPTPTSTSTLTLLCRTNKPCCCCSPSIIVTRHTSHVLRHTSHVTRHTSHVTRHTSHVTRHTSHVKSRKWCVARLSFPCSYCTPTFLVVWSSGLANHVCSIIRHACRYCDDDEHHLDCYCRFFC